MQGGSGNFRGPKWGPLMACSPPEPPQDFQGVHSFLSRANGSPHQSPGSWNPQSPRWRGQISQGLGQDPPWSPRGHAQQPQRGLRSGSVQNAHQAAYGPQMQGQSNGSGRRSINPASVSPLSRVEQQANLSHERGRRSMMASPDSPTFPSWGEGPKRNRGGDDKLGLAERLSTSVYNDLLIGHKGVSTAKVAQGTLSALGVTSFESIGVMPQDILCLRKLALLEGKVNAFIHSHVAGKKITTLYDLSLDLTRDEGVKAFEDLGLGPLLCHPLVGHYFSPPIGVDVQKITAGDVIQHLSDYIDNLGKDTRVQIESFLAYVAKERSLPGPQHLCIRIQSLGMHIGFIRRSKKAEKELISIWESRAKAEFDEIQKPSVMERVSSFLAAERNKNASLGKRKFARFTSEASPTSDDDVDDLAEGAPKKPLGNLLKTSLRSRIKWEDGSPMAIASSGTTCPYPSAAEERARVKKQELRQFVANSEQEDFYLSSMELQEFVTILKDACENRSLHEVLMKMIEMSRKFKGTKKRSGKSKIFKAYPAIGLLNVAVLSVKAGYWDSMYKNFLDAADETKGPLKDQIRSVKVASPIDVDCNSRENTPCQGSELPDTGTVAAAVSEHYVQYLKQQIVEDSSVTHQNFPKKWWLFLHWVYECEKWINAKFSMVEFSSLGHGSFSYFLEKNLDFLPRQIIGLLDQNIGSTKVQVKVPRRRVLSFLSQALPVDRGSDPLQSDHILGLLCRQFKVTSVEELGADSLKTLLEGCKGKHSIVDSNNQVLFLAPLLPPFAMQGNKGASLVQEVPPQVEAFEIGQETRVGVLGNMTSADAVKCLLEAPLLADLCEWSQWNAVFAPTLGPLLDWLEREGATSGLYAMVTCEGALLRIDGAASPEGFLLATVKGCGNQMAAAITSLVAVYGGTANTPAALLKSHASKGLEILLGSPEGDTTLQSLSTGRPLLSTKRKFKGVEGQAVKLTRTYGGGKLNTSAEVTAPSALQANGGSVESGVGRNDSPSSVACRCVVECLSCLLPELRMFAVEILLPALSPLVPSSSAGLLSCCSNWQERSILHGVGLALGIPEWTSNFQNSAFGLLQSSAPSTISCAADMEVDNHIKVDLRTEVPAAVVKDRLGGSTQYRGIDPTNLVEPVTKADEEAKTVMQLGKGALGAEANKVIEDIRRYEFGIGQDIQGKERDLLSRQHARMGRALHRLSSDLYSQDSHFVLELVQNADDNAYDPGVEAALLFVIQEDCIVVLNNETGFTTANIRALCDVGNSTKSGQNTGYIGHKGIGFKSVFRVTNSPEIHSNGFHVKFDISEGDLGFILPTCIPSPPASEHLDDVMALFSSRGIQRGVAERWNTRINLPIKASLRQGEGMNLLASKFNDLHPSLLLFLNHLRCIAIRNDLLGSTAVMHREDLGEDLVKVVHEKGTAVWMVVRQQLKAAVHRPGITETEIALAFQLSEVSPGTYEAHCEQQQVFAFLPLRGYGLRFIVQGDFKVPSSREEVDCDSDWNQWLRSEIPNLFIHSVRSFQRSVSLFGNPGQAISNFLSFVPMEGEVLGFFSPLPKMILSGLRGNACLPVEGGGWALPCVLLRGWTNSTRQLLPDSFLSQHLGLCYLDKDVVIPDMLASKLGVQQFGTGTLVALMKSVCQKKEALAMLDIKWVVTWLLALHDCFESEQQLQYPGLHDCKSDLQNLAFIPLSNGLFTSLADGPVWFAGEVSEDGLEVMSVLSKFVRLPSELRIVHPVLLSLQNEGSPFKESAMATSSLLSTKDPVGKSVGKVVRILQMLGVSRISSHEVLKSHVLPAMAKQDCLSKDPLLVVEYLGFAMSHLESNCMICTSERFDVKKELQKCAVILTSSGLIRAGEKPIHFSPEMGNNTPHMRKILGGTNLSWVEVSPLYLQLQAGEWELEQWRTFFKTLSVTDFVQVVYTEKKLLEKGRSVWTACVWEEEAGHEGSWMVQDWESPELMQLLLNASGPDSATVERFASVLVALDCLWDEYYHKFCQAIYAPLVANVIGPQKTTVSSFRLLLQQCTWVTSSLDGKLHEPTALFQRCDAVEGILGRHGHYLFAPLHSEAFMKALGLRTRVTLDDALHLLQYWSHGKGSFEASLAQMTRLYSFLWENCRTRKEDVVSVFRSDASIFVPLHWNGSEKEVQKGVFYPLNRVCWSDPTHTLDVAPGRQASSLLPVIPLSSIYHGLQDFFVGECNVHEEPSFDGYLEVIRALAGDQPPSAVLDQVMEVFCLWSSKINAGEVEAAEIGRWKARLEEVESCVFATNEDKWVSMNDRAGLICVCDDEKLGEEFKDSLACIHFVLMRDEDLRQVRKQRRYQKSSNCTLQPLVQALCIPKLSEMVEREVSRYGLHDSGKIEALVGWVLPYAQRYLKHHHVDQYQYLEGIGILEALRRLQFVVVDELYFQYSLKNSVIRSYKRNQCTCILQGNILHVVENFAHDYCNIYVELSRLFFRGKPNLSLANFLHLITLMASSGSPEKQVEDFILNVQGIQPIPDGDDLWTLGMNYDDSHSDSPTEKERVSAGYYLERHVNRQNLRKKGTRASALVGWPPNSWKPLATSVVANSSPERNIHATLKEDLSNCLHEGSFQAKGIHEYRSRLDVQLSNQSRVDFVFECEPVAGGTADNSAVLTDSAVSQGALMSGGSSEGMRMSDVGRSPSQHRPPFNVSSEEKSGSFKGFSRNVVQSGTVSDVPENAARITEYKDMELQELSPLLVENVDESQSIANFHNRDVLVTHPADEQQRELTGRSGEALVFQHLCALYGPSHVKWLNQEAESGAAYDIVIRKGSGQQEFVEVKATRSRAKDWFEISAREWEFARIHAESFTIMRVFLGSQTHKAKLLRLPNPIKLAQDQVIQLALLLPPS